LFQIYNCKYPTCGYNKYDDDDDDNNNNNKQKCKKRSHTHTALSLSAELCPVIPVGNEASFPHEHFWWSFSHSLTTEATRCMAVLRTARCGEKGVKIDTVMDQTA
jgi:hypothetical protein